MKLKHPYVTRQYLLNEYNTYISFRKVISDNKLSFMFNRMDEYVMPHPDDGYIYIKPIFSILAPSEWEKLHYNHENQETIENTLITVWIFEGRTPGENGIESYTKIKGYRKHKNC